MAKYEFTNTLLKEAIADAEAVRQTAIENAKLSLEETFTPQIKTMLSRRLRAEAETTSTEYPEGPAGTDSDSEEKSYEKAAHAVHMAKEAVAVKEVPFQDATAEHDAKTPQDTSTIGTAENKMPADDADDSSDIGNGPEAHTDSHTDWYDDWSDSDFDLDEVIRELEEDVDALSEKHDEESEEGEEAGEEGEEHHESPEGGMEKTADLEKNYADNEDESVETSPAANGHKYADASLTMDGKGHEEMGAEMGHDHHDGEEPQAPEAGEEELDLEAILRELEAEENPDDMGGEDHMGGEEHGKIASHMKNLETELAEYRKAVNLLRGKLQEVNLLNAKLLYTNRMFRKDGLTNEQKVTIVENFDRATNVREVKMVYTVLVETLTSAAKSIKATKSSKKVVTEGFASKATSSTAPKAAPVEIIAENTLAKRLQQLAGII